MSSLSLKLWMQIGAYVIFLYLFWANEFCNLNQKYPCCLLDLHSFRFQNFTDNSSTISEIKFQAKCVPSAITERWPIELFRFIGLGQQFLKHFRFENFTLRGAVAPAALSMHTSLFHGNFSHHVSCQSERASSCSRSQPVRPRLTSSQLPQWKSNYVGINHPSILKF